MMVGPTVLMVRNGTGAPAMAASSVKISWSSIVPPRPPAIAAELPDHLAVGLAVPVLPVGRGEGLPDVGRHQAGEVLAQLLAEPLLLGRVGELHPPSAPGV